MRLALFDYGTGNLHSLTKALEQAGAFVAITSDWDEALSLDGLVLPGVGAFGQAAASLPDDPSNIRVALEAGLPCLGICLGMQLLFEESEESDGSGIGLLPGTVRRLNAPIVPQIGWNDVDVLPDPIFEGANPLIAYYANSYVCVPIDESDTIAWSYYDDNRFVAGIRKSLTWGVQFHPEKSSDAGRQIIANFVAATGEIS